MVNTTLKVELYNKYEVHLKIQSWKMDKNYDDLEIKQNLT